MQITMKILQALKNLLIPINKTSFDDEIDAELERRKIIQYIDDEWDEPHWDEGKLYWARKMFREGAKWANKR